LSYIHEIQAKGAANKQSVNMGDKDISETILKNKKEGEEPNVVLGDLTYSFKVAIINSEN
jgi:hypothetical protein